jgi:hypothetical protein
MKALKCFILALTISLFFSCTLFTDNGKIIVQNQTGKTSEIITDVWLQLDQATDWVNVWHGQCAGEYGKYTELSFLYKAGSYNVRVRAFKLYSIGYFYETGYKSPIKLNIRDSKFIIYDGNGIYDMDQQ